MADIEKWITVNGVHIPIMKGESKAKAVGRFIKGKKEKKIKEGASYLARTMGGDEKQWAKGLKESGSVFGRAIKGRAKTREELNRLEDRYYTISEDLEYQGFSRDDAHTEGLMASKGVDPMKRSQYKQSTHRYKDTKYKLKEDKIVKTPISHITVDTNSYVGTHGKEPGRVKTYGRANWGFKIGNDEIFINDTYANAKRKAVKEASRRGLWSVKVLG